MTNFNMADKTLSLKEKYHLYEQSVQNHEGDIEFLNEEYQKIFNKPPVSLREDFCGTAAMACSWTTQGTHRKAWGIDIDPEPIDYGMKNHYSKLSIEEKKRMQYIKGDVNNIYNFKVDIIAAFNFSYQIFKKRQELLCYFKNVKEGLSNQGVFFIDIFGGTQARQELEEETEFDNHSYYWDCDKYNPITHETLYHIHFKARGEKYEKVFTYDWRLWSIAEIQEVMEDAGFKKILTYWEGEDEDGEGNGHFYLSKNEENCDSWVTYICGIA